MSVEDTDVATDQPNMADRPPGYADQRYGRIGEISGSSNTTFASTHGPVNTGPGHQYNGPVNIGLDALADSARRAALRRLVSVVQLDRLETRFVQPPTPGYRHVQENMHKPGIVAISGRPGCGRRAAALMLLYGSGHGTSTFEQLSVRDDNTFDPPARTIQDDDRLLLDLSALGPDRLRAIETHLASYRAEVERRAYLVVVLPHRYEDVLSDVFYSEVIEIERPDWREVIDRHLSAEGIQVPAGDLAVLSTDLAAWPMRDLAKLAGRVSKARDRANGDGTPRTWLHNALSELTDQSADAADQIKTNPDGRRRALLLTAAMLEGASTDAVFDAEQILLDVVKYPPMETHAFSDQDLAERLSKVKIKVDSQRRIKFSKPGYDNALRTHFWTQFPGFREHFRSWVARVVDCQSVAAPDKIHFVERFIDQALAVDRVDDVLNLAFKWAYDASPWSKPLAELVLQQVLENERYGRKIRQQFYDWAVKPTLPVSLAEMVIRLSQNVVALRYPDQALVRLRHLARHNDSTVRDAATEALLTLTQEYRLWRRLLYRLCENPAFPDMHRKDRALFLELTRPGTLVEVQDGYPPLITNRQVRQQLTVGWQTLLKNPDGVAVEDAIGQWLGTHATHPDMSGLLDVLVDGCSARPALLGRLFAVSLDWVRACTGSAEHAACDRTVIDLRSRIDRALGLDFINAAVNTEENAR